MIRLFAAVLASLLALPVCAATLERLTLDEMIAGSTAIVRGQIEQSYAASHGQVIYTHYRVRVSERWKGPELSQMDVVVPGGTSGGLRQTFSGAPTLTRGSEYILFLWQSRTGLTHVIGLSQGIFTLSKDINGDLTAYRPAVSGPMVNSMGRPVSAEAIRMPLNSLSNRIRQSLNQGASKK